MFRMGDTLSRYGGSVKTGTCRSGEARLSERLTPRLSEADFPLQSK